MAAQPIAEAREKDVLEAEAARHACQTDAELVRLQQAFMRDWRKVY